MQEGKLCAELSHLKIMYAGVIPPITVLNPYTIVNQALISMFILVWASSSPAEG